MELEVAANGCERKHCLLSATFLPRYPSHHDLLSVWSLVRQLYRPSLFTEVLCCAKNESFFALADLTRQRYKDSRDLNEKRVKLKNEERARERSHQ